MKDDFTFIGSMVLIILLYVLVIIMRINQQNPVDPVALMTLDVLAKGDICWLTPADTVQKSSELDCIVDGEYAPLWECYYPQKCN